jgi:hypothetical protein
MMISVILYFLALLLLQKTVRGYNQFFPYFKQLQAYGRLSKIVNGYLVITEDRDEIDKRFSLPQTEETVFHVFKLNGNHNSISYISKNIQSEETIFNHDEQNIFIDGLQSLGTPQIESLDSNQYLSAMRHSLPVLFKMNEHGLLETKKYYNELSYKGHLSSPLRSYGAKTYFTLAQQDPFSVEQTLMSLDHRSTLMTVHKYFKHLFPINDFLFYSQGEMLYVTGMLKNEFSSFSLNELKDCTYRQSVLHLTDLKKEKSPTVSFPFEKDTYITDLLCVQEEYRKFFVWFFGITPCSYSISNKTPFSPSLQPTLQCAEIDLVKMDMKVIYEDSFSSALKPPSSFSPTFIKLQEKYYWTSSYAPIHESNLLARVHLSNDIRKAHVEYFDLNGHVSKPVLLSRYCELVATVVEKNQKHQLLIHNRQGKVDVECNLENILTPGKRYCGYYLKELKGFG